jgi:hypothetical protein
MTEIPVDTERYERRTGKKPVGRAFWSFRLISGSVTVADKIIYSDTPATYDAALKRAKDVAELRRSAKIIVEPPPGE